MAGKQQVVDLSKTPVTTLRGVGPSLFEKLKNIDISTVQDLLFHLPYRYEDRTNLRPLGALSDRQKQLVEGFVELAEVAFRGRRQLLVRISDGTGALTLRFFYFSKAQQQQFQRGVRVQCFGEARRTKRGFEMVHPEYRILAEEQNTASQDKLTPVYSTTEGLQQGRLRNLVGQALARLRSHGIRDWIPESLRHELSLPVLEDCVRFLHEPPQETQLEDIAEYKHPAQQRLIFEEMLGHYLGLRSIREEIRTESGIALEFSGGLKDRFLESLPFSLTGAQNRVIQELEQDMQQDSPMLRLVQGDVGSGKTVVAAAAALCAVEAGYQATMMAPTELLAEQHFKSFDSWLSPLGIHVTMLKGSLPAREKRHVYQDMKDGRAQIIVGTHALFQEAVEFDRLGLVIVDEQHRFGVHQRLSLWEKGGDRQSYPHQLVMTATPIPRTLAMTAYADLDCSVIDELPPGRQPIKTVVVSDKRRSEVVQRVKMSCLNGKQAYWVCPLIEESETLDYEAAEDTAKNLTEALPELKVGLVHGRMKAADKDRVMTEFSQGSFDVLVATTVIEVGVDVPNATLMIIENAERMGLAQLHQLRGRVGRGQDESSCVLLYKHPLSQLARIRLNTIRSTVDGFEIARQDLKLRGAGEVLGTRQTGLVNMKIADLIRDADLLPDVHRAADVLLSQYPTHVEPLIRRWTAEARRYAQV